MLLKSYTFPRRNRKIPVFAWSFRKKNWLVSPILALFLQSIPMELEIQVWGGHHGEKYLPPAQGDLGRQSKKRIKGKIRGGGHVFKKG